jgi:hypothetical protein
MILAQSCAIHAKFPYICFVPECVKGQLGIDRLPGLKKKMKAKAQVKRRKAMAKRSKKKNDPLADRPGYSDPREEEISSTNKQPKPDSVYAFRGEAKKQLIYLIFSRSETKKDSLSYFYLEEKNDISEDDKNNLSNYIKITGYQNISGVLITGIVPKNEHGRHARSIAKYRSKRLIKLLREAGINAEIIQIETPG